MAIIIDITEYLNQKNKINQSRRPTLKEIIGPVETWKSDEEKLRFYMELAEQTRRAEKIAR